MGTGGLTTTSTSGPSLLDLRPRADLRGVLTVLAVLVLLSGTPVLVRDAAAQVFPVDAIGRLVVDNEQMCTAFIVRSEDLRATIRYYGPWNGPPVYENWIVSAGHCFGRHLVFMQGQVWHRITRVIGYSGGGTVGYDVMVAVFFTWSRMPTLEPAFGEYPKVGDPLMLIGYGHGALMMRVSPLIGYDDRGHMEIDGYASPGNSGGPVLIPGTRRVVGVGIETTLDLPPGVLPVYCMLKPCGVKPPYTAAHIDRIRGVARLSAPGTQRIWQSWPGLAP